MKTQIPNDLGTLIERWRQKLEQLEMANPLIYGERAGIVRSFVNELEAALATLPQQTGCSCRAYWLPNSRDPECPIHKAALSPAPPQEQEPTTIVGKLRLFVQRFRALGGIPEMCNLAWELCEENERLEAKLSASPPAQAPHHYKCECQQCIEKL